MKSWCLRFPTSVYAKDGLTTCFCKSATKAVAHFTEALRVLYEDLRVYTIWRAEISHFRLQNMGYRKSGTEWEILGELALRLQHKEEAKDAFQRCLDGKFSAKALLRLLEMYANEGDLQRTLSVAIKLTVYHYRWYYEASYPSAIAHHLYQLGRTHGHAKIQYTLLSMVPSATA
jgi:hypothetical protein